jgi:hypothetical protein
LKVLDEITEDAALCYYVDEVFFEVGSGVGWRL